MQDRTSFDYIIIGNGLAGLQLALELSKDPFFKSYTIGLIDPSLKDTNDKTWSFWEQGAGKWDSIVEKIWHSATFESPNVSLKIPLQNYRYKTIRSIEFYNYAKAQLLDCPNISFIVDTVETIETGSTTQVIGQKQNYSATHIFDSRVPDKFYAPNFQHTLIHQHFKGWIIETDSPSFNPEAFTMMDYRFQYKDSTSFIYVLPFSETKALVEYTFFTPFTVETAVYEDAIKRYLLEEHNMAHFRIIETEVGTIPMTDFPFWKFHTKNITKIGTGGGWVKGSSGYSFKHTEKNVAKLLANIKAGKRPSYNLFKKKFKFYDKIFLKVLHDENEKGVWIFERFYSKNTIRTMFRFLDEETSFSEDLAIMKSLFSMAFIKAFFKVLFKF
ncbi:lycopene cyclase family protein [Gelidibacter salicanalis]|uniref:Lycopene cyclase n=1 Tax=Gelidibacter salicanalis TaxID=291193 RepID=A0A934KMM8_9FLAO|nr:lycopene cyclase family protein [Gelidibacter salicanalis]MBJ7880534.1 lycopene cyclase [Gelidibacter salicanalis]